MHMHGQEKLKQEQPCIKSSANATWTRHGANPLTTLQAVRECAALQLITNPVQT